MYSLILQIATRFLFPLLLLFSVFLLLRGHDEPGGGFVGGLVAAAAFVLHMMADSAKETRRLLRVDPKRFIGAGLGLIAASGVCGLLLGRPFLTGLWSDIPLPVMGELGTPLLFDVGVYVLVFGSVITIMLSLVDS